MDPYIVTLSAILPFKEIMAKKVSTQDAINNIWSSEWRTAGDADPKSFFTQRLFVEGYPVFKKYIPAQAKRILDVGSGSGRYGLRLAQDFPEAHVTISDILPESLELAKRIAAELNINNVSFEQQDVNSLSYPDESFDVVFCDVVIQHLPNTHLAMQEMRRVLTKEGTIIVSAVNKWGIHTLFKKLLGVAGVSYRYGYEKSYSRKDLERLFFLYHFQVVSSDGFFPAYGVFRLKSHHSFFKFFGKVINRLTKFLDVIFTRTFSKQFGFEVFVVGKKWNVLVKNSGTLILPAFEDARGGILISAEFEKHVPFPVKRIYYISGLSSKTEVRGNHAHKKLNQAVFCIRGSFRLGLDDGERYQKIWLRNPSYGIILGPKLWHNMSRFSDDCVIMVLASDEYDESDYLRSYDDFKEYLKAR